VTDLFAHDDAAYVFGALDDAERAEFEAHLLGCPECTARVREASAMADLLALVPADAYGPAGPRPARPRSAARLRRWHRAGIGVLAAACLAVLAVLALPAGTSHENEQRQAMAPVAATSLRASAALVDRPWGTAIDVKCHDEGVYPQRVDFTLMVIGRHAERSPAGSWHSDPGSATEFTGGTALPRSGIAAVQVLADSRPVLVLTLP
jgi:hypothetical protein